MFRDLGRAELITQAHAGALVLDLKGERLVAHYEFYAAFMTPEEYRLVAKGRQLGSLPIVAPLYEGRYLIFGGHRWRVLNVDENNKVVELTQPAGRRPPAFGGGGALKEKRLAEQALFADGPNVEWFPWTGDCAMNVLALELRRRGFDVEQRGLLLRAQNASVGAVRDLLERASEEGCSGPIPLAHQVRNKKREKHHPYLGDDLLAADYASLHLGFEEAEAAVSEVVRFWIWLSIITTLLARLAR